VLEWHDQGDVWLARASRNVGGRYKITTRTLPDGVVYDVHRLVRTGPDIWRLSYGAAEYRWSGRYARNYETRSFWPPAYPFVAQPCYVLWRRLG